MIVPVTAAIGDEYRINILGRFAQRATGRRNIEKGMREILGALVVCIPALGDFESWHHGRPQSVRPLLFTKIVITLMVVLLEQQRIALREKWTVPVTMGVTAQ